MLLCIPIYLVSSSSMHIQAVSPSISFIAGAHAFSDSYQMPFAAELVYSAAKNRTPVPEHRDGEFWTIYKQPQFRMHRLCSYTPGSCHPCDELHIQRVMQV